MDIIDAENASSSTDEISSKAVVKYEEPILKALKSYVKLEQHTDLNTAPSNWLKENILGTFTEQSNNSVFSHKNKLLDFSSLLLAGRYPDMFAEVDVVSSSKHIKKLLKTPFNLNTSYSMTVHRMGKSLFLNDFDVPLFLKTNNFEANDDLQWLYELYCSADKNISKEVYPKKRNKELSQMKKIESKFMYYSIGGGGDSDACSSNIPEDLTSSQEHRRNSICDIQDNETSSKPPSPVKDSPSSANDFPKGSYFLRDALWTFEDITMLVGSDLPIFGGGKYPAVSLRLRDSTKPINILTGIDYWLDNLMCNVPELMMCYHVEGIVQKYERIKTTELPYLTKSQFKPNVVKDVAQNILSFLKSNCTQEGHTYWLFKSSKDDVVKLYDLTSISRSTNGEDPFSGSVAFLLYKIAYNMYVSTKFKDRNIPKLVTLLHNCIALLDTVNQPEILLMASYILSDLYTHSITEKPNDPIDNRPVNDDISDAESPYTTDDDLSETEAKPEQVSVKVNKLCIPNSVPRKKNKIESMNENLNEEEKCKRAIAAIIEGLTILKKKPTEITRRTANTTDHEKVVKDGAVLPVTKQFENTDPVLVLPHQLSDGTQTIKPFSSSGMTFILFEKAAKCYLTLVRISLAKEKFGRALRFLEIAFNCLSNADQATIAKSDLSVKALMFYGDILTFFASKRSAINVECEKEQFHNNNKNDENMSRFFNHSTNDVIECFDVSVGNIKKCFEWTFEELLVCALDVYEESLKNVKNDTEDDVGQIVLDITRRLGNIKNELGVLYMNKATSSASQYGVPSHPEMLLWKKSLAYFEDGVKLFEFTNDRANIALLYSNTAKLMRLCAQVYGNATRSSLHECRGQFTVQEQTYFNKAFEYYQKALSLVQTKDSPSAIADNILMELSGAYFTMATLIQDYAPLTTMAEEKAVKQITSAFMKSLQYAENVSSGNEHLKKPVASQIGWIHQKLASLYHHILRNQISDHGRKNYRSLAELHYNKVYSSLSARLFPARNLQCIMEHLAFYDFQLQQQGYSTKSLKAKQELLFNNPHILEVIGTLQCLSLKSRDVNNMVDEVSLEELCKLTDWLHGQLSSTMKETIKYLNNKQYNNFCKVDLKAAKRMFELVIRGSIARMTDATEKLKSLFATLKLLQDIFQQQ